MGDDCQIDFGEEWPKIVSATYLRRTTAPRALRPALLSSRLITVLNATLGVDPASCAILPRASPPRGPHSCVMRRTSIKPPVSRSPSKAILPFLPGKVASDFCESANRATKHAI